MRNSLTDQLSLGIHLPDDETFASYYPTKGNDELIQLLKANAEGDESAVLYFWGPIKSGRSHLLHATCAHATECGKRNIYIPLSLHTSLSTSVFEQLEQQDLICIDDVDSIAGNSQWEQALFDLYNRVIETKHCRLILSGTVSPNAVNFVLPDLVSRMKWGLSYQLQPMLDDEKLHALQRRSAMRGLILPDDVGRFLLNRLARDLRTLFDVLDKLDKESMIHKRKLTIPFIKEVLQL